MDTRYASRKWLLAVAAFLASVAFFALGRLTADQWISLTTWVLGLYGASNVAHVAASKAAP